MAISPSLTQPLQVRPTPKVAPEQCVVGLTKSEAEELLDSLERRGHRALTVEHDEATGFTVRWCQEG
jgi:hypothetical protein